MFCCWNLKSITKHIRYVCLSKGRSSVWISRHSLFSNNDLRTCPDWTRSYLFCSLSLCVWGTSFLEGGSLCVLKCLQSMGSPEGSKSDSVSSPSGQLLWQHWSILPAAQPTDSQSFASCKAIIEEFWPDDRFLLCVITNRVIKTNSKDTWCLLFRARDVCISIYFATAWPV